MAHQMKFVVHCHLETCIEFFEDAVGRKPTVIRLPRGEWERDDKPARLYGIRVEPCDGRMMILEG